MLTRAQLLLAISSGKPNASAAVYRYYKNTLMLRGEAAAAYWALGLSKGFG